MLVSCIMPTSETRTGLRALACKCFLKQDWPDKELIIVDDNVSLGEKLNVACERAKGDILIRFDDDDWSAPNRISDQVKRLQDYPVDVTGYNSIYFWDIRDNTASRYRGAKTYCLGTSLCFKRSYWESNKFQHINFGEDLYFQKKATDEQKIVSVDADQLMVARIHNNNTGSSRIKFGQVPKEKLPKEFFIDLGG